MELPSNHMRRSPRFQTYPGRLPEFNKGRALGGRVRRVDVNGQPGAMFMDTTDRLIGVMELDIVDGAVQSVRTIVNPDKLQHLGPVSDILRRYSNPES